MPSDPNAKGSSEEFQEYARDILTQIRFKNGEITEDGALRDEDCIQEAIRIAEIAFGSIRELCLSIAALFALRLVAGSAVERLLLLDRFFYLREEHPDCVVELRPLFDPAISPRNMALLCIKATKL